MEEELRTRLAQMAVASVLLDRALQAFRTDGDTDALLAAADDVVWEGAVSQNLLHELLERDSQRT